MSKQSILKDRCIYIHGSGANKKIANIKNQRHAWINLSHLRAEKPIDVLWSLTISDGLLFTVEELKNKSAITTMNLDKQQSLLHRIKRRDGMRNLTVNNLFCYSNKSKYEISKRLRDLNISCRKLKIVSDSQLNTMLKTMLGKRYKKLNVLKNLTLSQKFRLNVILWLKLRIKLPSKMRPSTGMATLLMIFSEYSVDDCKFIVSGITGQIDNENVHPIDQAIYDYLKTRPDFSFSLQQRSERPIGYDIEYGANSNLQND